MTEEVQCPICGQFFTADEMSVLDNGNSACIKCVEKEKDSLDKVK